MEEKLCTNAGLAANNLPSASFATTTDIVRHATPNKMMGRKMMMEQQMAIEGIIGEIPNLRRRVLAGCSDTRSRADVPPVS